MTNLHLKEGIMSGIILGDGHLHNRDFAIDLLHTLPQLSYLVFKLNLVEGLGYRVKRYRETKKRTNLGIYTYCSGRISGLDVRKYHHYQLPQLLDGLNPLGLLIWWLDDGHLSVHQKRNGSTSRFGYLNTQSYTLEQNQLIQFKLKELFGIETRIHVDSKSGFAKQDHYRIYINAVNFRRMIDLVREFIPWVPQSMLYKLNMQYVVNNNPESPYLATHYNF